MNDLGLNLDGPKPLKGVLNIPASGAVAPQGGQKFATVLENRVQSDLSQVDMALETYEPAITQPATKFTWTPPTDEIEVQGIIAHHPVDPIIDAERLPHSSVASMGKSAASDAVQPVLQKQPGKLLDLVDQSEVEPNIILQPTTNVNLNATPPAMIILNLRLNLMLTFISSPRSLTRGITWHKIQPNNSPRCTVNLRMTQPRRRHLQR